VKYPTPSDYVEALQFPDLVFGDPELAAGEVAANALGLPRVITGAYAAVFRIETEGNSYAVRCFLTDSSDRRKRYRAVDEHLRKNPLDAITPFEFQDEGVLVGGERFPILKMPWIEGEPLEAFVARHVGDRSVLLELRDEWRTLIRNLIAARFAHGDLQHGNVLVRYENEVVSLQLVDYDAAWVPALRGRVSPEVGQRNYQHPDRTEQDFGPWLDRFPGLVVYTALTALAEEPDLWASYATGENLLFQSEDFLDPDASPLFEALSRIEAVRPLAEALARSCFLPPRTSPLLEDVLAGEIPAAADVREARRRRAEPVSHRRVGFARWAAPMLAVGALATGVLLAVGHTAAGAVLGVGVALTFIGSGLAAYGRLSSVRRRRRMASEATVLRQWIEDLGDQLCELDRERNDFMASAHRLREERLRELQDEALERRLKHHFVGEMADHAAVGHRAVIRLKAAGVRNAFHATGERVNAARDLTGDQRAAISNWRDELAAGYASDVPAELSTAEEQRLRRMVERRLEGTAGESARVRARIDVQREELARVEEQVASLPSITPARYLAYALRLRSRPES
jgi:hypothetical protein